MFVEQSLEELLKDIQQRYGSNFEHMPSVDKHSLITDISLNAHPDTCPSDEIVHLMGERTRYLNKDDANTLLKKLANSL